MRRMLSGFGLAVVLACGVWTTPSAAQVTEIGCGDTFTLDEVQREPPGTVIELASFVVTPADLGRVSNFALTTTNNESVHEDNNLVLTTGGGSVTFVDVEREGEFSDTQGPLTLGDTLTVDLVMGEDGVSSAGFSFLVECLPPTPAVLDRRRHPGVRPRCAVHRIHLRCGHRAERPGRHADASSTSTTTSSRNGP